MKILYLLDSLNRGGAETLALDVCRNAAAHGLEITFVATGGGVLEPEFATLGKQFMRLQRRFPIDLALVFKLRKIIKEQKIEVVHAHQAVEGVHLYLATVSTKVARVLSFHGYFNDTKNRHALNFLIPRTHANIVVSNSLRAWLKSQKIAGTDAFQLLYNGVDANRLHADGAKIRTELKLSKNNLLCGMIGNFYRGQRKDQMTVCHALPQFFAAQPHAHFVFVGGATEAPEKLAECVKFCQDNNITSRVHFLGVRSDVPQILAALDIFVLSSRHEGLPLAVIEAMLTAQPCVLSDIEPLAEISGNGHYAALFQTGNAAALTAQLLRLADDATQRKHLAQSGYAWAQKNFSIAAHLENLRRIYQQAKN